MAADESRGIEKHLPAPPSEPDISLPGFHLCHYLVTFSSACTTSFTCRAAFYDELLGMGRVELESLKIRYQLPKAGMAIYAGVANAMASYEVKQVAGAPGGLCVVSNAMNAGDMHEKEIVVPGNLSTQIQPVSSMLPDFKVYLGIPGDAVVNVEFTFRVYGPVVKRVLSTKLHMGK